MDTNIVKQYEKEFAFDDPIPYKDLLIYPISMYNYIEFFIAVNCLMIDKNKIPNPKIISMSYLDYLFYLIENDINGELYFRLLIEIFMLCFKVDVQDLRLFKDENNKAKFSIKNEIFDKDDFDIIKNIILNQNIINYDDTYIDPQVEKALRDAEEFINKHKKKIGSLEDQIICVLISTSLNMEEIKNLTIRKFSKILERVDYKLHYEIYKTASMSGFVTFKEEIDHWMSDLSQQDKYAGSFIEYGQFQNKINQVT